MRWGIVLFVVLGSCGPADEPLNGIPCGPAGECPNGLECNPLTMLCRQSSTSPDARVDASSVDAPSIDAPSLDAPSIDAPSIDAPSLDAPAFDAPALDAPALDAPPPDAPPPDAPALDAPDPPPVTTITSGPPPTSGPDVDFSFVSNEAGTFECSLDGAPFAPCAPPQTYVGLLDADNPHTFQVRAVDLAGQRDPTPATRTWNVDSTAPTITLVGPADGVRTSASNLYFVVSTNEGTASCAFGPAGGTLVPLSSCGPITAPFPMTVADYTYRVTATDAHGNATTVSRTWTVDNVSTEGPFIEAPRIAAVTWNPVHLVFAAQIAQPELWTYECTIDWNDSAWQECYLGAQGNDLVGPTGGRHTLSIRASQNGQPPIIVNTYFTITAIAPLFHIIDPPSARTTESTFTVTHDGTGAVQCGLAYEQVAPCPSGRVITATNGGGMQVLRMEQTQGTTRYTAERGFYTPRIDSFPTVGVQCELASSADTLELWHFDTPWVGQRIDDASGNGGHAVLGTTTMLETIDPNIVTTASPFGTGLAFVLAEGDRATAAVGTDAFTSNAATLEMRYRPVAQAGTYPMFVMSGPGGVSLQLHDGRAEPGFNGTFYANASSLTVGAWSYLAVTYDEASGNLRLYVNGGLQLNLTVTGSRTLQDQTLYTMGPVPGILDEVRVTNGLLSATEIQTYYDTRFSQCF